MINYAPDGTCLIAIAKDLCYLAVCVNEGDDCAGITFKLANDIDLTGVDFTPIGDDTNKFNGTFDGDGHTISNLRIASSGDEVGLFGYVGEGGTIKNVNLQNVTVNGNETVGGLVGYNCGTVENCTANATVNGNEHVGGFVGFNSGTDNDNEDVGGLIIGWNCGTVENCTANAKVSGSETVGAVGGFNDGGTVENCTANVTRQKSSD